MAKKPQNRKHYRPRLVPRSTQDMREVVRIGYQRLLFQDLYANLLAMSWANLLTFIGLFYIGSNLLFADIYYLNKGGVSNSSTFYDAFFFSVQTMATIGYGRMWPTDLLTNFVVTIESFWGFTFIAFFTGLVFAKFSLPKAMVMFSDVGVVSNYNGQPHLKIRMANQRTNRIVNATIKFFLLRYIQTDEGLAMRQIFDLKLVRSHVPLLSLTWTLMHPLDQDSPLYGMAPEILAASDDEFIVTLNGLDETLSQPIYAHHSYHADEIIYDAVFEDVLSRRESSVEVNYNLFHAVKPASLSLTDDEAEQTSSDGERRSTAAG